MPVDINMFYMFQNTLEKVFFHNISLLSESNSSYQNAGRHQFLFFIWCIDGSKAHHLLVVFIEN